MSGFFNSLVNADDSCGPVNPLAQLSKGLQGEGSQIGRDRFVALSGSSASGSSSFRSHALQPAEVGPDAAANAFFHGQPHPSQSPLDLHSLRNALPQHHAQVHSHAPSPVPMPAWAADFMQNKAASPAPLSDRAWQKSRHLEGRVDTPPWAQDFVAQAPLQEIANTRHELQSPQTGHQQFIAPMPQQQFGPQVPWQAHQQPSFYMSTFEQQQPVHDLIAGHQITTPLQQDKQQHHVQWEDAFMQHAHKQSPRGTVTDLPSSQMEELHESLTARSVSPSQLANQNDPDLLARTAGDLLQNVSGDLETNAKMRDSSFMALMRKLRDREVVVEGDKMVEAVGSTSASVQGTLNTVPGFGVHSGRSRGSQPICVRPNVVYDGTGNLSATDPTHTLESLTDAYEEMNAVMNEDVPGQAFDSGRAFQGDGGRIIDDVEDEQGYHWSPVQGRVPGATSAWEEDFDFDNQLLRSGPQPPTMEQTLRVNAQQQEWGDLQSEWDRHQATATGLDALNTASYSNYPFHARNPYLLSHSRQHLPVDTLLEKEADVQMYPENASAWLSLGLKQQENEREPLAIQALLRALELDSSLGEAWLGLAVSYTNDNLRGKAYSAIERWAELQTDYREVVQDYTSRMNALGQGPASDEGMSLSQRHAYLTGLLVEMARAGAATDSYVDPEVQIALGVLFNASEEYTKACDCFSAALSVRPDDPHLYNRLGATLANSGKSVDAIEYYFRALELQPDFARATFNLAIACINLGKHQEAAEHLLRSLQIQDNSDEDVGEPILQHITESEHVESSNLLWETLATCCNNLKRADLAQACANRNLAPFRSVFNF